VLDGYGGDRLPRVSFTADSPLFGRGLKATPFSLPGSDSPHRPTSIGRVANVIAGVGVGACN
jgi:hypothetical protein